MTVHRIESLLTALWVGYASLLCSPASASTEAAPQGVINTCTSMVNAIVRYQQVNQDLSPADELKLQAFENEADSKCEKNPSPQIIALSRKFDKIKATIPNYAGLELLRSYATQQSCLSYGILVGHYMKSEGTLQTEDDETKFADELVSACTHDSHNLRHSMLGEIRYKIALNTYIDQDKDQSHASQTLSRVMAYETTALRTFCKIVGTEHAKIKPTSSQKIEETCIFDPQKGIVTFTKGLHFDEWATRQKRNGQNQPSLPIPGSLAP